MTKLRTKLKVAFTALLLGLSLAGRVEAVEACTYRGASPCAPVCCDSNACCDEWLVRADYLYWRALQGGLPSSCREVFEDSWRSGFRVGAEYDSAALGWDIAAFWTHYYNSTESGVDEGHLSLHFDTIDLLLGKSFTTEGCLSYKPYVGLRGARIRNHLEALFYDDCQCTGTFTTFASDLLTSEIYSKQKFWGLGPVLGVNGSWPLGCGFSLYGNLGVGILYGHFNLAALEEFNVGAEEEGDFCARQSVHACQLVGDVAVGVAWEKCLCNDLYLLVRVGLEHHRYFNQNQIGSYGDLCLDGLTAGAGLKF